MSYRIVTETSVDGLDLTKILTGTSIGDCRKMCDDLSKCGAFVWSGHNDGTCILKEGDDTLISRQVKDTDSVLYVKTSNSSFWYLWVLIGILGIIVFVLLCKRSK